MGPQAAGGEAPAIVHEVLRSPGQPLDAATRTFFEPRFGRDFSQVRVHAGAAAEQSARDVNAHAYTVGHNIVFGAGRFAPGTNEGRRLIAHELTHVMQQERSGVAAIQRYSDATILAEIDQNVSKEDTKAQRLRIEHLTGIFSDLTMPEADDLLKRLTGRKKGDKLAAEFHYRLSTKSRQKLLGILQKNASTLPLVEYSLPRNDPKYIDNVIEEVRCRLIIADRYTLIWKGGKMTVYNPEIDWKGKSKALPIVDIHKSKTSAAAAAAEWRDEAKGYDTVVTYYRGDAGVILPTWISPETAPVTYNLIMGVNAQIRVEGKAWYDFFSGLRTGLIIGAAVSTVLRLAGFVWLNFRPSGGGAPPEVPMIEPPPASAPDLPVAEPRAGGAKPPAPSAGEPAPAAEPAGGAKPPAPSAGEPAPPVGEPTTRAGESAKTRDDPGKAPGDPAAGKPARAAKPKGDAGKAKGAKGKTTEEEAAAPGKYRACFVAGTQVVTPSGGVKIEALHAGQEILGRPDGGELGSYPLGETFAGSYDALFEVHVAGAMLRCTPNHRFWVGKRGWVPAYRLTEGDLLETLGDGTQAVERILARNPGEAVATYELRVPIADSYFVIAGSVAVRVHNNGLTDPALYNRILYWLFGKKPVLRPTDVDGLSVWRTDSFEDVKTFHETRVNVDGRPPADAPSYFTEEQLRSAGISAPETPGDPASSSTGKLPHHSLRPVSAPEYPSELTTDQMEVLRGSLTGEGMTPTVVKPRDLKC